MVNVIDNGARNRTNMMPVGIKIVDDKGNTVHAAKTDLATNYISLESKWFGSSSSNNGGDPDHPTAGADYYPGSVYDGTVSGRTLLYSGVTSTTDKTNIVFPESIGTGLRLLGDGIQLRIIMYKTLITRGVKGSTSIIPIVYDIKNQKVAGKFVTTSPVPISNKKEDLITESELINPLNGVGEGDNSTEIKAPELHVQYDSKTNSINIWNVQGYALDNLSDTKTGSLYDVQVTLINDFYVQDPVAQLPANMNLFNGDTDGDVKLTGINTFFDNARTFVKVILDDYIYLDSSDSTSIYAQRIALSTLGIPSSYLIDKQDLISGNLVSMNLPGTKVFDTSWDHTGYPYRISIERKTKTDSTWSSTYDASTEAITVTENNSFIKIGNGTLNATLSIDFSTSANSTLKYKGNVKIVSVTSF